MRLIKYWPIPSKMPKSPTAVKSPDLRAFMAFLEDWFYRDLSAMSHLTLSGLIMQAGPLLKLPPYTDEYEQRIPLWKSQQLGMALVLTFAQISEVEAAFRFDLADRAKYIWGILNPYIPYVKELWDARYERLLG